MWGCQAGGFEISAVSPLAILVNVKMLECSKRVISNASKNGLIGLSTLFSVTIDIDS
jgi:hypothetical protein